MQSRLCTGQDTRKTPGIIFGNSASQSSQSLPSKRVSRHSISDAYFIYIYIYIYQYIYIYIKVYKCICTSYVHIFVCMNDGDAALLFVAQARTGGPPCAGGT